MEHLDELKESAFYPDTSILINLRSSYRHG